MTGRARVLAAAAPALALSLAAAPARAGGQWIADNGAAALQRAGAFCAEADDLTALSYNPAGLMSVRRFEAYAGVSLVHMESSFQRAGVYPAQPLATQPAYAGAAFPEVSSSGNQPIPFVAGAARLDRFVVALGVFAPHGHPGRAFPSTVTVNGAAAPAPQRYDAVEEEALIASPSLAAAVAVTPWLDAGVRLSWGFAHLRATTAIQAQAGPAASSEQPEEDGLVTVDTADPFVLHAGAGLKLRAGANAEVGLSWTSPLHVRSRGALTLVPGALVSMPSPGFDQVLVPVPADQERCGGKGDRDAGACLDLDLPQTLTLGLRWAFRARPRGRAAGDLELDVRWEQWSSASDYTLRTDGVARLSMGGVKVTDLPVQDAIVRHGMQDSWSVRLGGGGAVPLGGQRLHLRAGAAWDTASAPESWTRVDLDTAPRLTLAAGAGLEGSGWRVDLGGAWVRSAERTIADQAAADPTNPATRRQPDIIVPLTTAETQPLHPFNAGKLSATYLVVDVAVSVWW